MIAENKPANLPSPKGKAKVGPGHPPEEHRFKKGWKGGPGNPFGGKIEKLRAALINAVTPADFRAIARKWVMLARAGDIHAGEVLMDKTIGKSTPEERSSLLDALKLLAETHTRREAEGRL